MGAKIGGGRGRRRGFTDINVTPLVDVMLVLLVVFMVTAPLLTTGLKIDLPEVKASNTPVKDARLLVTVNKEERIFFGDEDVTAKIEQVLLDNQRVQREKELYIRADKEARYGVVARVVAAARASGVVALNLLVQPDADGVGVKAQSAEEEPASTSKPDGKKPKTGP